MAFLPRPDGARARGPQRARPRILLIGPDPSTRGGIAQFSSHLAMAVGDEADAHVISYRRLYPKLFKAGRQPPDHSTVRPPVPSEPLLLAWRPWTWRRAAARMAALRPDLVVLQWWHPGFGPCLRWLARRAHALGARTLLVCHNARPHEAFPAAGALTRRALRSVDRIAVLSSPTADEARAIAPAVPVDTLEHPPYLVFDGARVPPTTDGGSPTILFFGYVRAYKGLGDLIQAMPKIRETHPGAVLVVAGQFLEPVERYRELAVAEGVAEAVRLHPGYVANEDVASLFAAADVVALPYRRASQSGVIPQALAFGTRIVATTVGGIPEVLGERGVLVPPADPAALAEGIVRALAAPRPTPRGAGIGAWSAWRDLLLREARAVASPAEEARDR